MPKITAILFMLLIPASIFAKDVEATLLMKDGSTRTGSGKYTLDDLPEVVKLYNSTHQ